MPMGFYIRDRNVFITPKQEKGFLVPILLNSFLSIVAAHIYLEGNLRHNLQGTPSAQSSLNWGLVYSQFFLALLTQGKFKVQSSLSAYVGKKAIERK